MKLLSMALGLAALVAVAPAAFANSGDIFLQPQSCQFEPRSLQQDGLPCVVGQGNDRDRMVPHRTQHVRHSIALPFMYVRPTDQQ